MSFVRSEPPMGGRHHRGILRSQPRAWCSPRPRSSHGHAPGTSTTANVPIAITSAEAWRYERDEAIVEPARERERRAPRRALTETARRRRECRRPGPGVASEDFRGCDVLRRSVAHASLERTVVCIPTATDPCGRARRCDASLTIVSDSKPNLHEAACNAPLVRCSILCRALRTDRARPEEVKSRSRAPSSWCV
jgi:hypothetical protein